jgi:hypothetical protein
MSLKLRNFSLSKWGEAKFERSKLEADVATVDNLSGDRAGR